MSSACRTFKNAKQFLYLIKLCMTSCRFVHFGSEKNLFLYLDVNMTKSGLEFVIA